MRSGRWPARYGLIAWAVLSAARACEAPVRGVQCADLVTAAAAGRDAWSAALVWGTRSRWLDPAPSARQQRSDGCGPATLQALLAHHGVRVPQDLLWSLCRLRGGGTSVRRLGRIGGRFGLVCQAESSAELLTLPLPAIVHLKRRHFVLLLQVSSRTALVLDPACGRVRVPKRALERQLSGVALVCEGGRR